MFTHTNGEPSVSNGVMPQLPSFHLFIHRVPAKLLNGIWVPRKIPLPATALVFYLIVTDQTCPMMVLIDSVDALPPQILIGLSADAADFQPHHVRVSFPEPCPASDAFSETRQGPGNIMLCSAVVVMPLRKLPEVLCLSASFPGCILFPFLGLCI